MMLKKQRILIVDDESCNIAILMGLFQKDYKIIVAKNGEEALDIAMKTPVNLILLDILMPGVDGYEVCRKLKQSEKTKDISVIFITSKDEAEDEIEGIELGGVDYIKKPFNISIVKARVKSHIELKESRDIIHGKNRLLENNNEELKRLNNELQKASEEIKTLKGLLPICASCKKIRTEDADPKEQKSWIPMETYISNNSEAEFTHGICPECVVKLYPVLKA
ncbi:MAG: response regulator [Candidatus Anammoxibacter sp.]